MTKKDFIQYYEFTIKCIDREDNLSHYRLSWALQANTALIAFLAAASFVVRDKGASEFDPNNMIVAVVALVGLIMTFCSWRAILEAQNQLKYLMNALLDAAKNYEKSDFIGSIHLMDHVKYNNVIHLNTGYPRPFGERGLKSDNQCFWSGWGQKGATTYCVSIMLSWFFIILYMLDKYFRQY